MSRKMIPAREAVERWRKEPEFVEAYAALEEEFSLAAALIDARARSDLSQEELAKRMGTSQPAIARLESGKANPSLETLRRYARATGTKLRIDFVV